jgi:type 1 fimbria pilin
MKNSILFLIIVFLSISVSGCASPKKEIEISGNVKTTGNSISVNGTSTLEVGSELKIELKKIDSNTILEENTVKVDENGNYRLNFSRENREEEHKLSVTFYPYEQTEDIQKVYGTNGENISESSPGLVNYNKDGEEYTGVRMFDFIYKVGDGSAGQRTILIDNFDDQEGEE